MGAYEADRMTSADGEVYVDARVVSNAWSRRASVVWCILVACLSIPAAAWSAGGTRGTAPLVSIRADHMVLDLMTLGDRLIVGTQSGRVDVYDRHTGAPLPPLFVEPEVAGRPFAPTVRSLAISPGGGEFSVVTSDDLLHRFALRSDDGVVSATPVTERKVPGLMVAHYLDDDRILLADMRGELALLDTRREVEVHRRQLEYDPIYALALSPDGSLLAIAFRSSRVQIVDPESGETRYVLKGHLDSVFDLEWIDDRRLVTAGKDKRLLAWELGEGDPQPSALYQGDHYVTAVGVDRARGRMAVSLDEFDIGLLQISDGSIERRFEGHTAPVQKLVFVDEGRALISAGSDARVFVWNLEPEQGQNVKRR
jgi:hypothetical protein